VKTDIGQLVIVLTKPQNMLICHAIFHCKLFLRYNFLAEFEIHNFADVGRHCKLFLVLKHFIDWRTCSYRKMQF